MGLVPTPTRKDDKIVLLAGGRTPYVVREKRNSTWTFIGVCYIHGVMNGEAWDGKAKLEEFTFV